MVAFTRDGFAHLPWDARVDRWAKVAADAADTVDTSPHRHGGTWFVGVDALPNAADGSVSGVPLAGPWSPLITTPAVWHAAQVSVVYPGYPGQDPGESDAAHRYRRTRDAAHLDGLLPEGPMKRRHLREPHGFVLGLPLSDVADSPLVVWAGSHTVISKRFAAAFAGIAPAAWGDLDVTEIYQAARQEVFETCKRVLLPAKRGEATLLHRHMIHGVAPWESGAAPRPIAYFRPLIPVADWL